MKYVAITVAIVAVLNAFVLWCMCVAAAEEDRRMEEMMRKRQDERAGKQISDQSKE